MPRRHALLALRLERLAASLPALAAGAPDAIHDARVATRRLRELVPLLDLPTDQCDELRVGLRAATRRLGRVRELDVLLALVARLSVTLSLEPAACARITALARAEREREFTRAAAPRVLATIRQLVEALRIVQRELAATASARTEAAWRRAIATRVAERAATACARLDEAGTAYAPDRVHALRVALKKLRYALELAAEAGGGTETRDLRALARAQDELGDLHDLEVLAASARSARGGEPVDVVVDDALALTVGALELRCRELHARFVRHRGRLARVLARHLHPAAIAGT